MPAVCLVQLSRLVATRRVGLRSIPHTRIGVLRIPSQILQPLRRRRLHDAKRTAVSLLTEDGARDPILTYIAWGPRKNVRDLYITLSWDAFCAEMLKLKLPMPTSVACPAADDAAATAGQSLS